MIASVGLVAAPNAAAAELNLTGVWSATYHCEVGPCAGDNYPATDVLRQAIGSDVVTGYNNAEELSGTLTGNTLVLHTTDGPYQSEATLTISAEGRSWSGPEHDNNGTSGTDTATLQMGTPGSLSQLPAPDNCVGEVFDSASEGAKCETLVPFGLDVPFQIVVSPDGKNAYSVAVDGTHGAVIEYQRNQATGALTVIGCLTSTAEACASENVEAEVLELEGPSAIAVSPNGKHVYVTAVGHQTVVALERNESTGLLSVLHGGHGCVTREVTGECEQKEDAGIHEPYGVAVSPGEENVYVTSVQGEAVAEFDLEASGEIKPLSGHECIGGASSGCPVHSAIGMFEPIGLVVSPDGKDVYVAAGAGNVEGAIVAFKRGSEGALEQLPGKEGCISEMNAACESGIAVDGSEDLVISPDGKNVYATSYRKSALVELERNESTGALSQLGAENACITGEASIAGCTTVKRLEAPRGVAISPGGEDVYVGSSNEGSVAAFARISGGALQQLAPPYECVTYNSAGCGAGSNEVLGLGGTRRLTVSPDGTNVYVAGQGADAIAELRRAVVPTVSKVEQAHGSEDGGTVVTIEGSGFVAGASVNFGVDSATHVTVNSASSIAATAPEASLGTVDVTVTTSAGTSATSAADEFTYVPPGYIGGIPNSIGYCEALSYPGDPSLSLAAITLHRGGVSGPDWAYENWACVKADGEEVVWTTAGAAPSENGVCHTEYPTMETYALPENPNNAFSWACFGDPTVDEISAKEGPAVGGTVVNITGTNFSPASAVSFGAASGRNVHFNSPTSLTATAPPGSEAVDVRVTNYNGSSPTGSSDRFTYFAPAVTSIEPSSGPTTGSTDVKIKGTHFLAGSVVTIDGRELTNTDVASTEEILAKTPAAPAGTYEVVVSSADGTSTAGPSFTYVAPAGSGARSASPASGVTGSTSASTSATTSGLPAPVLAHTGNVAPVSGTVLVELPGTDTFVPLSSLQQIPFGTVINATNGHVSVTVATSHGTEIGEFFAGEFILTQGANGMVLATLTGGNLAVCPTAQERSHTARARVASASPKHVVRKLWANAHGQFSTKGNYAAGAVEGTEWLTEDLCEGTVIRVTRDKVLVTNLVNHHRLMVHTGHQYLAKAP